MEREGKVIESGERGEGERVERRERVRREGEE